MKDYNNLIDALRDLRARGFTYDFNPKPAYLECPALDLVLHPEDFEVRETYRFESTSDADNNSVLYAIKSQDGVKGVLIDAYGPYASLSQEMASRLGSNARML